MAAEEKKAPAAEKEALAVDQSELWEDNQERDMLSLYFAATEKLPSNQMRTLVNNANNALKAMAGAEKMMASCERQHIEKICLRAA